MKLAEAIIGRSVVYTPFKGCDTKLLESGIITNVTDKYVFVKYGSDVGSKATSAEDLRY